MLQFALSNILGARCWKHLDEVHLFSSDIGWLDWLVHCVFTHLFLLVLFFFGLDIFWFFPFTVAESKYKSVIIYARLFLVWYFYFIAGLVLIFLLFEMEVLTQVEIEEVVLLTTACIELLLDMIAIPKIIYGRCIRGLLRRLELSLLRLLEALKWRWKHPKILLSVDRDIPGLRRRILAGVEWLAHLCLPAIFHFQFLIGAEVHGAHRKSADLKFRHPLWNFTTGLLDSGQSISCR